MNSLKPILGLEDAFGARAAALRSLQFSLFEIYNDAGYSEVIPPLVERPQALESGAGRFLSDQTLVFSDPADAGQLAIRPDMTPLVARIAASRMSSSDVLKLYYSGPVMLARPDARTGSRQQWQTGVECMGVKGVAGDVEVMHLAGLSMHTAGFNAPVLQVGHMGLIRALAKDSQTPIEGWVAILARRSPEDMARHLLSENLPKACHDGWMALASGQADAAWLKSAQYDVNEAFSLAATDLLELVSVVENRLDGEVAIQVDVSVVPRFLYHSGMVFTGFAEGSSQALLHGGRYDDMMKTHGRDMAATGFSCDLWSWIKN